MDPQFHMNSGLDSFSVKMNICQGILTYHPFLGILPELAKFQILLSHQ